MSEIAVWLHNVRSAHNVGSVFRTSDAAGVSRVFLSGYTPQPQDRFGRAQKDIAKTALGAETYIPWEYGKTPAVLLKRLKKEGWHIVAVEQDSSSVEYRSFMPKPKTVFLFGNEVRGISSALLRACDSVVEIPMHGKKESLNVSVTVGIILFEAIKNIK